MSTPANVLRFYAKARWGTLYGVKDSAHPTEHKGLDCGLFHGDVDVPALYGGQVVAVVKISTVGHYVTVRRADGKFHTYCHIVPAVSVTEKVAQGAALGRQALTPAEGGTQWQGQHTHLAFSDTLAGWGTWGPHNFDPTPGVIAVLTNTASSDGTPLNNKAKDTDTMDLIYIPAEDPKGALYLLFGEFFAEDLNRDQAVIWAKNLGLDIDNLPSSSYAGRQYAIDKAAANVARVKGVGGTGPADYVSDGDLATALAKLETDIIAAIPKGVPLTSAQTVAAVKSAFAGNTITLN